MEQALRNRIRHLRRKNRKAASKSARFEHKKFIKEKILKAKLKLEKCKKDFLSNPNKKSKKAYKKATKRLKMIRHRKFEAKKRRIARRLANKKLRIARRKARRNVRRAKKSFKES